MSSQIKTWNKIWTGTETSTVRHRLESVILITNYVVHGNSDLDPTLMPTWWLQWGIYYAPDIAWLFCSSDLMNRGEQQIQSSMQMTLVGCALMHRWYKLNPLNCFFFPKCSKQWFAHLWKHMNKEIYRWYLFQSTDIFAVTKNMLAPYFNSNQMLAPYFNSLKPGPLYFNPCWLTNCS